MARYDDIIHLPHHQSKTHPHMSLSDRAAQFSPFAALSGFEDVIQETRRLTDPMKELSEDDRELLDEKLLLVSEAAEAGQRPVISLTYFIPDERKSGGACRTVTGAVKKIDHARKAVVLSGSGNALSVQEIPIGRIVDISGDLVSAIDDRSS